MSVDTTGSPSAHDSAEPFRLGIVGQPSYLDLEDVVHRLNQFSAAILPLQHGDGARLGFAMRF